MDPLLDRIADREALLAEQARRLDKELTEVRAELERVSAARQVVTQLLAEDDFDDPDDGFDEAAGAGVGQAPPSASRTGLAVPHRGDGAEVDDLPADYQRLYAIVAEEQPVVCKRATAKLGLSGEPRHTEAVRTKLKRLVARGWLAEPEPGRFVLL